jgi:single-stranded-DNA-specific exonuclease
VSLQPTRWTCEPYSVEAAEALSAALGLSREVAAILVRRGYGDVPGARRFLAAGERHEPAAFGDGMGEACAAILRHVRAGNPIVVHGDYDVDGICSTAVLVEALRALGGRVSWHLPSRMEGGYGLSRATVDELHSRGARLLVTVDCGITAAAEVDHAVGLGMEVVVTDHHRPAERLPACPIVHPALSGYPFPELCATGVAHKLSVALRSAAGAEPAGADEELELVALATVADLVPLRGENRRLVREGLGALSRTRRAGLRALMRVAAVDPGELDSHALGFRLAPRLNAAGRLQRADAALELLLTEDEERAAEVADELDLLNRERQHAEERILFAAEAERAGQEHEPAYVLAGEGWHPGVIGIVAARMVERHHRPCVVIALDGGSGRGSGRSIPAFDLHAGLAACSDHLQRYGGHRAAAGLEIAAGEVEPFRRSFAAHAAAALAPQDLVPSERIDLVVPGSALGRPLAEELQRLAPFGHGNPAPTLLVPAAQLGDLKAMGRERQHANFTVTAGGIRAKGVGFRVSASSLAAAAEEGRHDLAVRLELNRWNGSVEPRLVLRAACAAERAPVSVLGEEGDFWRAVEQELAADLPAAQPPADLATAPPRPADLAAAPERPAEPPRRVVDRRGEGFAGVAGDLLSAGDGVLVVCADCLRRRDVLERVVGGLARGSAPTGEGPLEQDADADDGGPGRLALVSWGALAANPSLSEPFDHLLALDPPPSRAAEALLASAPANARHAFAHLAWGPPELDFALAVARAGLDLRAALAEAYRGLREAGELTGDGVEDLLRGEGPYPRPPVVCGRLLRVLRELGLVELRVAERACRVLPPAQTELERSPAFRAYRERLGEITAYLGEANRAITAVGGRVSAHG